MENIYTNELRKLVEEIPNTSAWKKGVKDIWKQGHMSIL